MKRFALRTPDELHEKVAARAEQDGRSINNEILHLLRAALNAPVDDVDRWARQDRT